MSDRFRTRVPKACERLYVSFADFGEGCADETGFGVNYDIATPGVLIRRRQNLKRMPPRDFAQPALAAVSDHRSADLSGDGQTYSHNRPVLRKHEEREVRRMKLQTALVYDAELTA